MRTEFFGDYRATPSELQRLWQEAVFVFDTNVLLDVFRYSDQTADEIVSVLAKAKDRTWIPYQVAIEYHRHLDAVIRAEAKAYADCIANVEKVIKQLTAPRSHPFIKGTSTKALDEALKELTEKREEVEQLITHHPRKEQIADHLAGRLGPKLSPEDLAAIYADGKVRYEREAPPGYKDRSKSTDELRYGDLVVWKSLLGYAKTQNVDVIFVTSDSKDDWFDTVLGRKSGPRKELVSEFYVETKKRFHAYQMLQFIEHARRFFDASITSDALQEIRDLPGTSVLTGSAAKGQGPPTETAKAVKAGSERATKGVELAAPAVGTARAFSTGGFEDPKSLKADLKGDK